MTLLLHIAERVINRPLLVHPDKLPIILGVLEGRIPITAAPQLAAAAERNIAAMPEAAQRVMRGPLPAASRFVGSALDRDPDSGEERALPYLRTREGVAIITITGSLINRGPWLGSHSGETTYEGIKHQLATAAVDPRTKSVILDIESAGGEAVGAFETAMAVRALAARKPVVAVVNGMAASAAYALAAGASRVVATPTGMAGSIGVVMLHADYSRLLDRKGITPTLIFAGARKVDGNPFEPLPDGVREDLQREVDQFYELFVASVAAGRRSLSPAAIRATEARTFIGADAVAAGLADSVGTFETELAELSRDSTDRPVTVKQGAMRMDKHDGAVAATHATTNEPSEAALARARAAGKAEGVAEGASAERNRITGIEKLGAQMKGHERLIADMKADGSVSPEQAAMRLIEAENALRAAQLAGIKAIEDVTGKVMASPRGQIDDAPPAATPEGWAAEYDAPTAAGQKLRAEFVAKADYVAFRANAHHIRILGRKSA